MAYQLVDMAGRLVEQNGTSESSRMPIKDYFKDKTVLLTGGTGFLGQLFVEKLLRTGVKEIFVLARAKKGKSSHERLTAVYSGVVFEKLLKIDPDYMKRVRVIEGNLLELGLGISEHDREQIIKNVQIVLHSAADVRFDETLFHLTMCNIRGTRELLRLSEQIQQLEVFLHISTAYSHCPRKHIGEQFYEAPVEPSHMIDLIEKLNGDHAALLEIITERLTSPWPNTYTFTKAITEELVRQFGQKIPIAIIRPSIIIATHEDPTPGWINNVYGLTGVLVSVGLGFQRILPYKDHLIGDIVCADFVINSTLAVGWITNQEKKEKAIQIDESDPKPETKIYNVVSYRDKPVTYGQIASQIQNAFNDQPALSNLWLPTGHTTEYAVLEFIYTILYHIIPGALFDIYFRIRGQDMRLLPMYRKCNKFMSASAYFMRHEWAFDNDRMKSVYDRMTPEDKAFFPSDLRLFNFHEYCPTYIRGMRKYIGKEDVDCDQGPAKRKLKKLQVMHTIVLIFYYSLIASVFYSISHLFGVNNYIREHAPFKIQIVY